MADLKLRLVGSLISCNKNQVATAESLGLRKIGQERVHPDNEATRGKINKISHLIEVQQGI